MPTNAEVMRNFLEQNFTNDEAFGRLYGDCVYHEPSGKIRTGEEVWQFRAAFLNGFSRHKFEIHQIDEIAGNVWCRWTFTGVHSGEFAGVAPTGREVRVSVMTASRMENGKVLEEWELVDTAALMEQITG